MDKYLDTADKLIRSLENSSLEFLEFRLEDFSLRIGKHHLCEGDVYETYPVGRGDKMSSPDSPQKELDDSEPLDSEENIEILKAPVLGVFYSAKSPESEPFVKVGDEVKEGSVLCIIEAMKMMNEIKAPYDCKVIDCLVLNEDFVEYDGELFKLEKL